ncbi:MAG: hypothetical protein NVV68_06905 [Dokdonella sp.]|nr:hypothetical protein [Dokdonella sp.]
MSAQKPGHPQTDLWGLTEQDHTDAIAEDAARALVGEVEPIPLYLIEQYYGTRENFIARYLAQAEEDEAAALDERAPEEWRAGRKANALRCRGVVQAIGGAA